MNKLFIAAITWSAEDGCTRWVKSTAVWSEDKNDAKNQAILPVLTEYPYLRMKDVICTAIELTPEYVKEVHEHYQLASATVVEENVADGE